MKADLIIILFYLVGMLIGIIAVLLYMSKRPDIIRTEKGELTATRLSNFLTALTTGVLFEILLVAFFIWRT